MAKTARMTLELNPTAEEALERLAQELGTTKVGAIRQALNMLDKLASERRAGRKLTIADENDKVLKEFLF